MADFVPLVMSPLVCFTFSAKLWSECLCGFSRHCCGVSPVVCETRGQAAISQQREGQMRRKAQVQACQL